MLSLGLLLIATLALSCLSTGIFKQQEGAQAQQYIQTIKSRNLVIDLGNGVKTNAQLTIPAVGEGPFTGVLLIPGSGAVDKNETLGFVQKGSPKPPTPFWQIAQYLSERGFVVVLITNLSFYVVPIKEPLSKIPINIILKYPNTR
jgi:hypothetical protein